MAGGDGGIRQQNEWSLAIRGPVSEQLIALLTLY